MMRFVEVDGRRYAQFESLRRLEGLTHAFSTRPLDVSMRTDAHARSRAACRRRMVLDFGGDPKRLYCCEQVHEPRVAVVGDRMPEPPSTEDGERRLPGFDAVVTDSPGAVLMTFSADCPLVLVYDPRRSVLGMAHASWRSTVAMVVARLIETMRSRFGCDPAALHAGVGPSAGPTRYEVKEDVYRAAEALPNRERLFRRAGERMFFDLWEANRLQLVAAGVHPENIEIAGICTMTDTEVFYSYRREGPGCGHFCLMAMLGKDE